MSSPKLNILCAYPYFSTKIKEILEATPDDDYRLIVDSGAFTAWNSGKEIKLDDFCSFLKTIDHLKTEHIVQLDVFGNPEQSWANYLEMRDKGFDEVAPVFTRGDTLEMLDKMYEITDFIFFGGIVVGGQNADYVKWFLNKNKGRDCHWLGFVKSDYIKKYRPASVDSSTWSNAARFGYAMLYDGFGNHKVISKKHFKDKPDEKMRRLLHTTGVGLDMAKKLQDEAQWRMRVKKGKRVSGTDLSQMLCTIAHVKRALEVEKRLGTKIYLAFGNSIQLDLLLDAYNYLTKGKPYE